MYFHFFFVFLDKPTALQSIVDYPSLKYSVAKMFTNYIKALSNEIESKYDHLSKRYGGSLKNSRVEQYKDEMKSALGKLCLDSQRYLDDDWQQRVFILDKMDLPDEFFSTEDLKGKSLFDSVLPDENNAFATLGKLIIFDPETKPPSKDLLEHFKKYMLRHYKFFTVQRFFSKWLYDVKVTKPIDFSEIDGDKSFLFVIMEFSFLKEQKPVCYNPSFCATRLYFDTTNALKLNFYDRAKKFSDYSNLFLRLMELFQPEKIEIPDFVVAAEQRWAKKYGPRIDILNNTKIDTINFYDAKDWDISYFSDPKRAGFCKQIKQVDVAIVLGPDVLPNLEQINANQSIIVAPESKWVHLNISYIKNIDSEIILPNLESLCLSWPIDKPWRIICPKLKKLELVCYEKKMLDNLHNCCPMLEETKLTCHWSLLQHSYGFYKTVVALEASKANWEDNPAKIELKDFVNLEVLNGSNVENHWQFFLPILKKAKLTGSQLNVEGMFVGGKLEDLSLEDFCPTNIVISDLFQNFGSLSNLSSLRVNLENLRLVNLIKSTSLKRLELVVDAKCELTVFELLETPNLEKLVLGLAKSGVEKVAFTRLPRLICLWLHLPATYKASAEIFKGLDNLRDLAIRWEKHSNSQIPESAFLLVPNLERLHQFILRKKFQLERPLNNLYYVEKFCSHCKIDACMDLKNLPSLKAHRYQDNFNNYYTVENDEDDDEDDDNDDDNDDDGNETLFRRYYLKLL